MKRTLSFILSLVMVLGILTSVPATVLTASAIEEGLSSVATVEPTAYGVLMQNIIILSLILFLYI